MEHAQGTQSAEQLCFDPDSLVLDDQICFALYSSSNKLIRLFTEALRPFGVTFSQYLVLRVLWRISPVNISDLASFLELGPNTVTPMVKRMQVLGFVSRSRHLTDERQVLVSVTEKTLNLRADVLAVIGKLTRALDLPEDRSATTRDKLRLLGRRVMTVAEERRIELERLDG